MPQFFLAENKVTTLLMIRGVSILEVFKTKQKKEQIFDFDACIINFRLTYFKAT